jgi:hypothetical protein
VEVQLLDQGFVLIMPNYFPNWQFQIILPGDKKEEMTIKDKTLSLDAQLAAVQAHIEDLEVSDVDVAGVFTIVVNYTLTQCF